MSIRHPRWRLASASIVAGLVVIVAAGACSAGGSSSGGSVSGNKAAAPAQAGGGAGPAQAGGGAAQDNAGGGTQENAAGGGVKQAPLQLVDPRAIIYTGTMTVRMSTSGRTAVDEAATRATGYALAAGGFVGGDQRKSDSGASSAQLTLRVPAAKFDDVVNQLHGLGNEVDRTLSSQDVTADVADVTARITNAQASVARVRALMDKAQTLTDITTLEAELSKREGDLESMQARQRSLTDATALSTITLTLLSGDAPAPVVAHKADTGFLAGLRGGWKAFTAFVDVLLTVLGALLPWIVLVGLVVVLPWMVYRRRRATPVALVPVTGAGVAPAGVTPPAPVPAGPVPD